MKKAYEGSYLHEIKTKNGDSYNFIAVDANVDPGPRRPFNFFGSLEQVSIFGQ